MKKIVALKAVFVGLSVVLLIVPLAAACAKPAPSPSAAPPPAAKPPSPVPPPSPVAKAPAPIPPAPAAKPKVSWPAALAQVIEGAKKEGELVLTLTTAHTPVDVVERMRKEVRDRYGVDLKLSVKAATAQAQDVATSIMEYKTGATPTYDLMNLGDDLVAVPQKEGVFELVDWKSLLEVGTIPEVMPRNPEISSGIIAWSGMTGIMYNPKKVSKSEVPKTLKELGDPKWKGRIGILSQAPYWARWAFSLGKDRVMSELKAIMKNQPFVQPLAQLNNRYLLGEADVVLIAATYLEPNREKGMPSEWQGLDFFEARDFMLLVRKGAKHPNAAKLFAVYMASPDGVRLNIKLGKGNRHYPFGGREYEAAQEAKKTGSFYTLDSNPKTLQFLLSKEYVEWQKEFELVLQGK